MTSFILFLVVLVELNSTNKKATKVCESFKKRIGKQISNGVPPHKIGLMGHFCEAYTFAVLIGLP